MPMLEPLTDKLSRLGVTEQMLFWGSFSQNEEKIDIPCLLDTGAGMGYLLVPSGSQIPFRTEPHQSLSILAEGTSVPINQKVTVEVTLGTTTRVTTLLVLETKELLVSVVFGRQLIDLFDLIIHGSHKILMGKTVLYNRFRDKIFMLEPSRLKHEMVDSPQIEPQHGRIVKNVLDSLCTEEESALPFCKNAKIKLRALVSGETKDTIEQEYCFELSLPQLMPRKAENRLYASSCYKRLPPQRQVEFDKLVAEYVEAEWWTPISRQSAENLYGFPANVFGIVQGEKLRLVADFRQLNMFFTASAEMPPLYGGILLLSLTDFGETIVADCSSAFLRVRLKSPLWIHTGKGDFLTHRMSFGLAFGPEGLRCSAGKIFHRVRSSIPGISIGGMFVDDWFLSSNDAILAGETLLYALAKVGFPCNLKKTQRRKGVGEITLYNMTLKYDTDKTTILCNRAHRLQKIRKLLYENLTKSSLFELAGLLAYDPVGLHPTDKVVADILRSVVGKVKQPWNATVIVDEYMRTILDWVSELSAGHHDICQHEMPRLDPRSELRLHVDSSLLGYGWVLMDESSKIIRSSAGVWKSNETVYSINRLESAVLLKGLRSLHDFTSYVKSAVLNYETEIKVVVGSDNFAAVQWCNAPLEDTRMKLSDSPEYRPILRTN